MLRVIPLFWGAISINITNAVIVDNNVKDHRIYFL